MSALRFDHLSAGYGRGDVLQDVVLSIPEGLFTVIVGPNGSGKTTLLRCAMGSIRPGRRQVFVRERDARDYTPGEMARTLAVVPQRSHTEYAFTVRDVVSMGRYAHTDRLGREGEEDRQAVRRAMEWTGVWQLRDRNAAELSGGEWQRVVIARAFAQQAPILLMDEPVNSLDINHQVGILNMVRDFTTQRDMTVVCVLHDLNLALEYAGHAVLMQEGRVVAQGSPLSVLTPDRVREVYGLSVRQVEGRYLLPAFDQSASSM